MSSWMRGVAVAVKASTGAGRKARQTLTQEPVVGSEVMPPLGDAVRFVDRDQGRPAALQNSMKPGTPRRSGDMNRKSNSPSR